MKNEECRMKNADFPSEWLPSPSGELEGGSFVLTEPLLWIQLVAEGSLSKRRRLGVAMAKVRYKNVEGSVFQ